MRIGLIQVDGKLPNLVLMKISAWHKQQGDTVELLKPDDVLKGQDLFNNPEKLYAAVVFRKNKRIGLKLARMGASVGGTGWWLYKKLPSEIEKIKPDYDLYGIDYGMGYLSRGCIRTCGPCVVWRKEGKIHHVAWPEELVNPRSKKITIMDGCLNGSPHWKEKVRWIIDNGYEVDITQGMDIRIIDDEAAKLIVSMRHSGRIHFAFDHVDYEFEVRNGIEKMLKTGIHPDRLTFFVLTNYNSTFDQDMKRIKILEEYGVNPFVMVYDRDNAPQKIKDLQRWCDSIPPIRKVCSFEDYNPKEKAV